MDVKLQIFRTALIGAFLLVWVPVEASVVVTYRGDAPNPMTLDEYQDYSPFDINGDGVPDFIFSRGPFFASFLSEGQNRFVGIMPPPVEAGGHIWYPSNQVVPLPEGTYIGSNATFPLNGDWHHHTESFGGEDATGFLLGYADSGLMQLSDAYIGVEFSIDDNIHFGWIHYVGFSVAEFVFNSPEGPITFVGIDSPGGFVDSWAYNSIPGEPIRAGEVPEPATVALLSGLAALLFAGVARWRRRSVRKPLD